MKMKNLNSFLARATTLLAIPALLCLPVASKAVPVTYKIDSSLSSLTLSGSAFGLAYNPQVPGATVGTWSGTITADLTAGVLTFSGGSSIVGVLNTLSPFSHLPGIGGVGVENYGVTASGFVTGFGNAVVNGIYHDLTLDITAGTAQNGSSPDDTFDMYMKFMGSSSIDYGVYLNGNPAVPGPLDPTGHSSMDSIARLNDSLIPVSLVPGDGFGGDTLTLPVFLHTFGSNRDEFWTGTIVAVVPEPSSLALGTLGLAGLLFASRNRSRARGI